MILKNAFTYFIVLSVILVSGCNNPFDDVSDQEKYQKPEGLAGKLYSQMLAEPTLTTFSLALEKTGYSEILNQSGSYTILAPTDVAFETFFQEHPTYKSLDDIPGQELERIVKFLILQNSWNKQQFREMSATGWTDNLDYLTNNFAYKKQTLLKEKNKKYWIREVSGVEVITDSANSTGTYKEVETDSRKHIPIFTNEFFTYNELSAKDYSLYYDRTIELGDDIYVADAKILNNGVFASNGFIYPIDKVVLPIDNVEQILEANPDYSEFLKLIREYAEFEETTDGFYNLEYDLGGFDVHKELIINSDEAVLTLHHGIVVPTNAAFTNFLLNYVPNGFGNLPSDFKKVIAASFFRNELKPLFTQEIENGFYNVIDEKVVLDPSKIVEKRFASNATLIGYDDFIIPKMFTSISAPLILSSKYELFLNAVLSSNANSALTADGKDYAFYIMPDVLLEADGDSSLYFNEYGDLTYYDHMQEMPIGFSRNVYKNRILNQVGMWSPQGIGRKEFIPNLAGNYIVVNNATGIISGKKQSELGFNNPDFPIDIELSDIKELTEFNVSNGRVYEVNAWFNYVNFELIVPKIKASYKYFYDKMKEAELISLDENSMLFYNEDILNTVFIPSEQALNNSDFDNMSLEEKQEFIKNHFVSGEIIFTDGREYQENYSTAAGDVLFLNPEVDAIEIRKQNGDLYYSVEEAGDRTNIMIQTLKTDYDEEDGYTGYSTSAVIHEIDTVIYQNFLKN